MSGLKIARGFQLPLDIVTRKTAILAKSGAGKSNTAKVIVEGVLDAGAQVVIIDPVGHWWGLRSLFPIPVLGGMNGDIPLDPLAGKLIADVAAESGQSLILDVSLMDSDGEMQRFAYEFAERFYKQKQLHPTAVLIVLEEADEFAPQDTRGANVPRMVGAWARIAKRGRGRGIGLLSVTLRSASLSKNVLNQSDGIVAMRTTAPLDIKAIREWVEATRAVGADEVIPSLPSLETGEAWFWIPEYGVLERVKVLKARSLDTSATPEVGAKPAEAKKLKPIDLAALGERMQSTVEKAKANDPDALRKKVRDLEKQLAARPTETQVQTETITERVEVPVLDGQVPELLAAVKSMEGVGEKLLAASHEILDAGEKVVGAATSITSAIERFSESPRRVQGERTEVAVRREPAAMPPARRPAPAAAVPLDDGDVKLGKGERTVLNVLAEYPDGRTQNELAFLAGYSAKASTVGVILANLRRAGLVEPGQPIRATEAGLAEAGGVRERPTGQALLDEWLRHPRMGEGERRVLLTLVDAYPTALSNDELCERTGYSPSASTMGVILSKLRKLGLVEKGARRVAPEFYEAIS